MHSTAQYEMVRLAGAANSIQAHIWQQALEQEGIRCQVLGDDLYAGIGGIPGIGAEIWVETTDDSTSLPPITIAAAVSSQLVSIPSTIVESSTSPLQVLTDPPRGCADVRGTGANRCRGPT